MPASVETMLFLGYNYGLYTIMGQPGGITQDAGFKLTAKVLIMLHQKCHPTYRTKFQFQSSLFQLYDQCFPHKVMAKGYPKIKYCLQQ